MASILALSGRQSRRWAIVSRASPTVIATARVSRVVTKQRFWLVCKVQFWLGIAFAMAKPYEGTCEAAGCERLSP